jgi:hypothetical protein
MKSLPPFNLLGLRPLKAFSDEGKLPMSLRHAVYLAKLGTFPAYKIHRVWHTSEELIQGYIRDYLLQQANPEAKKLTA